VAGRWSFAWARSRVVLPILRRAGRPVSDVSVYQRRIPMRARRAYSQNGEDGIIEAIFAMLGTTNRYVVEFGVEDGSECNSRHLIEHCGWTGLRMDGRVPTPGSDVRQAFITAENIEDLFATYGVPERPDLLVIDIDGNDYWVWQAITRYRPRIVMIEYNGCIPALPAVTVPYVADFVWDRTDFLGASLGALDKLGRSKGYRLIATDYTGVNAFFVDDRDDSVSGRFAARTLDSVYRPMRRVVSAERRPHPADPQGRRWVEV